MAIWMASCGTGSQWPDLKNVLVSGRMIQERVIMYAKEIGHGDFTGSNETLQVQMAGSIVGSNGLTKKPIRRSY